MQPAKKPATLHCDRQPRTIVGDLRDENGALLSSVQGATYGEVMQNAEGRACAMGYQIIDHQETTMTISDSIDRPTANIVLASETATMAAELRARLLDEGRPHHVSHRNLEAVVDLMRAAGRDELVHYAGASYHDDVAWQVCLAWLADPEQPESVLKSRALAIAAPAYALSPEQIRAANPGMR